LAISVIKQGRKFGITLILDTQSPTATSIPKEVTRNTSCGVAFSVADHIANDGLLGSGKYRAGIRATDLRMHTDRGTSVMVGVSDATFELVRGFYVPYADGVDMVTPVVTRAMTTIDQLRCTGPTTETDNQQQAAEAIDHLADIQEVLRRERRVRTQVVLTRLAELNPAVYEGWTFQNLSAALADYNIEPIKSGGVKVIRATDVTHALTYYDRHGNTQGDG
jgi:S-DNA-T family DNA segregation ATPase FtsK/SpoIIIE